MTEKQAGSVKISFGFLYLCNYMCWKRCFSNPGQFTFSEACLIYWTSVWEHIQKYVYLDWVDSEIYVDLCYWLLSFSN